MVRLMPNVASFFQLMNGAKTGKDKFARKLVHDIQHIKADLGKEREFMDMAMKLYDERQIGVQKGIQEGKQKGG